ncbi:MAG TPA: enoyl-CoA hydratase/isomerase family protein [Blastocatellia bacterium]|nr:enoyl-CoA hydratase/isomerase family protein [Blastocatellia bacterium]
MTSPDYTKTLVRVAALASAAALFSCGAGSAAGQTFDDHAAKYKTIQIERKGPVLVGRFYNPPLHVMNAAMVAELSDLLTRVETDEQTRVVVLTGAAPGVFIAHYDVSEIGKAGALPSKSGEIAADGKEPELHGMHKALLQIEALSKPVIAAINGRAHGGGLETALACDFRFMAKNGSVGLPEVTIGIIPGGGGTQRLPRLIGAAKARELIMLGKSVDGETAERLGIVTRAVEPDKLMEETLAFANRLAAIPAVSLKQVKRVFREGLDLPLHKALVIEQDAFFKAVRSEETRKLFRAREQNRPK